MDDIDAAIAGAVTETTSQKDVDLGRLSKLAREASTQQELVEKLEMELHEERKILHKLQTQDLPDLMSELGVSSLDTDSGFTIEIVPKYNAKITQDNYPDAMAWLDEHGFGDLIKTQLITKFQRGELTLAQELANYLANKGFSCTAEESVHAQTLRKFVKEMFESGEEFPAELFGASTFQYASIKRAK